MKLTPRKRASSTNESTSAAGITGGCYCGKIRYAVGGEPAHVGVCHCENCRRITGGQAVAWVVFAKEDFRYTEGCPTTYRSETGAIWSFCPSCGTTLDYRSVDRAGNVDVVLVTLDDPCRFPPKGDSSTDEKLPWVNLLAETE